MEMDFILWLLCFFAVVSLLGVLVYQLMCLSDLEFDYSNPFDSSVNINSCIVPEFFIHGTLGCTYLLTGHWWLFILNVPLAYYHTSLYLRKQHLLDVTEIFSHLGREKKYRLVKLAFYLLLFVIVIFKSQLWHSAYLRLLVATFHLVLEHEDAAQTARTFTAIHADM
ncbi:protein cornichon homolog 1 isoform X1 [Physcomitrium patens]|uniref:Cornichon-like protein n=2 Tax=Physcomitrium patens TaxID=3218 RepID=A0A7I4AE64_PHYPA|nr:protein cornichon homolog 4-like isoform X1 [Physcomitrium patens]XP_024389697.1 protein cornichon homolog 4-like isoform X1 [Physcomitrium patens]|eukprot:XP_024389696.1 protein cornichon homolog 4-like isoform X1 [Physcomitrella patens]